MIRPCTENDFDAILSIVNDGAEAYRGIIPADRWKEPYMDSGELRDEIASGVAFSGMEGGGGGLVGVMGVQPVRDVILIRHAYVRRGRQRGGVGSALLRSLTEHAPRPVMLGTWKAARWAVRFYEKHGFTLIEGADKDRLLQTYWDIPQRQVVESVIMADERALREILKRLPPGEAEDGDEEDRDDGEGGDLELFRR